MPAVRRYRDEYDFTVAASETEQNVPNSFPEGLTPRDVLRHFHVGAQYELVGCVHRCVGKQQP